MYHIIYIMPMP